MPRKKKQKEQEVIAVSEMEKEMADKKKENEQMRAVLEERKKLMKEYEELEAKERLMKVSKMKEQGLLEEPEEEEDEEIDFSKFYQPEEKQTITPAPIVKTSQFEKMLKEFNESNTGTIEVFRISDGKMAKIGKFPVKEYGVDLDSVAKKFGGGEYKLRLRNSDGTFAGEITEYYDEIAYPKPSNNPLFPQIIQTPQTDIAGVMATINQMNKENQLMMMNMMSKMVEAMGHRNQFINSMKDIVEMKELISPKKTDENPVKSVEMLLNVLMKGIELGKTQSGDGGSDDSLISDMIKMLVPAMTMKMGNKPNLEQVIKEVKNQVEQKSIIRENPPQISQPEVPPVKIEAETKSESKEDSMANNLIMKIYKPVILSYAKENRDPHDVAVQIFSKIPEQYFPICYDFTLMPNSVDEACNYIPELSAHKDWVGKVLSQGKILFEEYFKQLDEEK